MIGSYHLITYIPDYKDIFNDDNVGEEYFIANTMMADLKKKNDIDK